MPLDRLIGVRHLAFGRRKVKVVLTRNAAGTVSGQCLLPHAERPIIDGPTVAAVLRTIKAVLEVLLLVRRAKHS